MTTQFFETYNGTVTAHEPREHGSESKARAYATELSSRKNGQVAIVDDEGDPKDTYVDGAPVV